MRRHALPSRGRMAFPCCRGTALLTILLALVVNACDAARQPVLSSITPPDGPAPITWGTARRIATGELASICGFTPFSQSGYFFEHWCGALNDSFPIALTPGPHRVTVRVSGVEVNPDLVHCIGPNV